MRWDEDNAAGLCPACHMYFSAHPAEHVEWFINRLGKGYELLLGRMRVTGKPDKQALTLYYKAQIAYICGI